MLRDPEMEWTAPNLDIGAEIMHLVDRELRARGMTRVVDAPDVHVLFGLGVDMQAMDLVVDEESGVAHLESVPKGAVVVVLADPRTKRVMWYGVAEGDLQENPSLELGKERLDYAISKMFDELPR